MNLDLYLTKIKHHGQDYEQIIGFYTRDNQEWTRIQAKTSDFAICLANELYTLNKMYGHHSFQLKNQYFAHMDKLTPVPGLVDDDTYKKITRNYQTITDFVNEILQE